MIFEKVEKGAKGYQLLSVALWAGLVMGMRVPRMVASRACDLTLL